MSEAFSRDYERLSSSSVMRRGLFWVATAAQAIWYGTVERMFGGSTLRATIAVDWRAAWRALLASPALTAAAVLSLALGIGANTALFSIVNSLMLKSLPVHDPDRIVRLEDSFTNPIWEALAERQTQLGAGLLAYETEQFHVSTGGPGERVTGAWVSGSLFDVLGLQPSIGRPITLQDDDRRAADRAGHVVAITDAFWRRHFGAAPDVIGRTLWIDRVPLVIVGVTPARFTGLDVGVGWDLLVPIAAEVAIRGNETQLDSRTSWWLHVMARLSPGQTVDEATAALRAVQPQIRRETMPPASSGTDQKSFLAEPLTWVPSAFGRSPLRERYRQPLSALVAVVGAVLLIACANIANLLVARAAARRHELSVRLALGASRARLARQLFAESVLLSLAGAGLGLLVAAWGSALIVSQLSTYADPVFLDLSLDWRVLAFTLGAALTTALLFGTAPALFGRRADPGAALKAHARTVIGDGRFGLRHALVVVQVALSVALVVVAGLFIRTFQSLDAAPLGFDPRPLIVAEVSLPPTTADPAARWRTFERFRDAVVGLPGVQRAALSHLTPISDSGWNAPVVVPDGIDLPPRRRINWLNPITPGWLDAYGMRLIAGRDFTASDRAGQPLVMIVNEAFARQRIGEGHPSSALGRRVVGGIETLTDTSSFEIVGVVNDAVYVSPRRGPSPTMYVAMAQLRELAAEFSLTVQTASGVTPLLMRQVADALHRADTRAMVSTRPFAEQIRATMTQERLVALMAGFFGLLALVMVSIGLYGLASYWVNRRRAEIGIRVALGARPDGVVRLVLGQLGWLIALGLAAGIALSLWASRFVEALLFNLSPRDPATLAGAVVVLVFVGVGAGWLPARRAARLDPVAVLRE
jgi:predicted permease